MVHELVDIPLTVTTIRAETPGHRSIVFARPPRFEYEAGDWIDLGFSTDLSGGKTYSLTSSPTEPDLVITFKEGHSGIKRALQAARPGDEFRVTAYGNDYDFARQQHRSSVLIAGGVGVAPFRSMLAEMVDLDSSDSAHLLYLNRTPDFLFQPEFEAWRNQLPNVRIDLVTTGGMKRKQRSSLLAACVSDAVHYYYVAGPPGMVESTEQVLMAAGVDHDDIRVDIFDGY